MTNAEDVRTEQFGAQQRGRDDDFDLVGQYLHQIGSTPLLSADEEVELAKRIEVGVYAARLLQEAGSDDDSLPRPRRELEAIAHDGERAKDHMIRANLRLVVAAARRYYRHAGASFLDIVQDGNLGLMRAVEKFDYAKGFKFSTYAMWWIRQSIERGRADRTRTIRLPVHVVESLSKLGRAERELSTELGREPTVDELAAELGVAADKVQTLRDAARDAVSLDVPVGDDGQTEFGDLIEDAEALGPEAAAEYHAMTDTLRSLVGTLPEREAKIITLRYGLQDGRQHSLAEVGDQLGLTRERVRQLEKAALAELRNPDRHRPLLAWAS